MKLYTIYEEGVPPIERAKMHARLTLKNLTTEERAMIKRIKDYVSEGDSYLKIGLIDGTLSIAGVIFAIKNNRCLRMTDRDLGSTYLSSVIGNTIRALFQGDQINIARRIFGLAPVSVTQTSTHDTKQQQVDDFQNQPQSDLSQT